MVAAEDSPEELPSGWTVLRKVLRTGREVSIYTNLETRKRFFSKDDLFKHVKSESNRSDIPPPTSVDNSRQKERVSLDNSGHKESSSLKADPVTENGELSEWLPDGWKVEVRIRKKGGQSGKEYKCYIDPSNTGKFYSKVEVLRYLEIANQDAVENQKGSLPEKKTGTTMDSKHKINTKLGAEKRILKNGLLKPTKAGSSHSNKPLQTNGDISKHKKRNTPKPEPVNGKDKRPEWLPDGWKVEVRLRKSGVHSGKEYKCYIDPSSSGRFYSKPEVLQHLKTVKHKKSARGEATKKHTSNVSEKGTDTSIDKPRKHKNCAHQDATGNHKCNTPEKETCTSADSEHKAIVEKCVAEDLPLGWTKEIRIRQTSGAIRKDPFYTDPVNGYVFRSKKDVLRYVNTGVISKHTFKPKKSPTDTPELTRDEVSTSSAAKRRKLEHLPSKQQLFSGKKGSEMSDSEPPKTEEEKISITKVFPTGKGKHSLNDTTQDQCAENSSPLPKDEEPKRDSDKSSPLSEASLSEINRGFAENGLTSTPSQEKASTKEAQVNSRKSAKQKALALPARSSKRLAGHVPDEVASLELGERALISAVKKSRQTEAVQDVNPTCDGSVQVEDKPQAEFSVVSSDKASYPAAKDSPRKNTVVTSDELHHNLEAVDNTEPQLSFLFGSDPCLEFAFKTLTGELPLDDSSENRPTLINASSSVVPPENSLETETKKGANGKGSVNRSTTKNKKELNLPRRSSRRLSGGEPNSSACEQTLRSSSASASAHAEPSNRQHKSCETGKPQLVKSDPTPQMQEPEMQEPDVSFSIADYWSDPCLDFAFKTLTGVIPIEDSLVQGYFQEQVDVSDRNKKAGAMASPDFGSSSLFQNDMSSQFIGPEKFSVGQNGASRAAPGFILNKIP